MISAAGSIVTLASSEPATADRLWKVPRHPVGGTRQPLRWLDRHLELDGRKTLVPAFAGGLAGEHHRQVGRERLEPAHLDDLGSRGGGGAIELVDHPTDERYLAGQVHVMGAPGHAGLDHRAAIQGVGADQVEDHAGPRGQRRK